MSRATIDFGIDLGTTNSAIAMLDGTDVRVFRNPEEAEYTPSAVWIDRNERVQVGRVAKERIENDPENAFAEFKIQMGKDEPYTAARTGRELLPEELSAEVLKALRGDVRRALGVEIRAAVVTVPAAFELPQCKATGRAAELAGLVQSPLLQEPVAAALAYGFQSESEKVFWLVFDLGGGTFDAAVIQVREGAIQVVNHGGDNHLGGKLIDWEIVDQLLVPAVNAEHSLADFRRGNPQWRQAFQKLKLEAEKAKIRLSRSQSVEILIDYLCSDDSGRPVEFEYELRRPDVEALAEPFIVRAINISRRVLKEKRLGPEHVEKVLLVGGPTQMEYLRERLRDPQEGLGIELEFRVDPMTVVARGAAIFAGTQRLTAAAPPQMSADEYALELEYSPMGPDEEPLVGGRVVAKEGDDLGGFTIEFVNEEARPPWRSGKVGLTPQGTFITNLWAEKGRPNTFLVELHDASGTRHATVPNLLTYTIGLSISEQPLINSVGVALANGEVQLFCEKGAPLPARRRSVHRTTVDAHRGEASALITIPVVEGENRSRADRNRLIGKLEIRPEQLKRDVPAGSEVEITLEIDESRLIRTKAYIPVLDQEFEEPIQLEMATPDPQELERELERERERLREVRDQVGRTRDLLAEEALQRIDRERMEHDVEAALAAARDDRDAADKADKRLTDLKQAIDDVEDALEWPALLAQAEEELEETRGVVQEHGSTGDRQTFATLERETRGTIESRDADLLRRRLAELSGLKIRILREQPGWWVALLQFLEERQGTMRDQGQAQQALAQGMRAINNNDVPSLQAACQQLIALLPADAQEAVRQGFGSTVL